MVTPELPVNGLQATTRRVAEPERVKPDASFKINDSLQKIGLANPNEKVQVSEIQSVRLETRDSFTEQQIVTVLDAYIQKHAPETAVTMALKSHHPEIQGENIIIQADNQLQMEKLETLKLSIQNALMHGLNNGFISLSFQFFDNSDGKEEEKLFTSGQKFEHFLKLNPVISELKNIFGLELE